MLDDVRQRLLHEPVERSLDLRREAVVAAEVGNELDRHAGLLREVVREPLERGDQAEVVERLGTKLDREAADVLEGRAHELAHLADRRLERRLVLHVLETAQAEEDRRERLPGLVVELAGETAALELLCVDDSPESIARDPLAELDRDSGARGEDLGEPEVFVGEAHVAALLVVRDDHADRLVTHEERDIESAARAEPPRCFLLHLGVVEDGVDALTAPSSRARASSSTAPRARGPRTPPPRLRRPPPSAARHPAAARSRRAARR